MLMKYMKIEYTKGHSGTGYMELKSGDICVRVTDDIGNEIPSCVLEYHIIDTSPIQPVWALEEHVEATDDIL